MKCAIIWGPRQFRCFQLKDMYTEQLARTVDKMIAHIRSGTPVGKTMQITIDGYQAIIGSATPFFELNPTMFPHRPDTTTTKLTFLWEALHALGASIKLSQQWVPKLKFDNDVAIMDALIDTQKKVAGTSAFVPNQCIVFANTCQLWLRVTTLSDIVVDNGKYITQWAMCGDSQNNVEDWFPYQPKPPPQAWKEWRMALRQTFLGITEK